MEKDFAVIIGINDYTLPANSGLRTLKGAITDANHFEDWTLNPKGGAVPPENCFKIISAPNPLRPIQEEIDDVITDQLIPRIKALGGRARRLYFYFAGHGLGSMENAQDTALCLANWSELKRNKALSSESYKNSIQKFGYFEEIIFLADCCRNTKYNVKPMHPSFDAITPNANTGKTKLFVGYATQYQDQSFEIEENENEMRGVFTKVLLEGLTTGAVDNGIVTADGLRDYLVKNTPLEAQKHSYKQIPEIIHSFTSDVPLIVFADHQIPTVQCTITFDPVRNAPVELYGSEGLIRTIDTAVEKSVVMPLPKGLYVLKDTLSKQESGFMISLPNLEHHVNF